MVWYLTTYRQMAGKNRSSLDYDEGDNAWKIGKFMMDFNPSFHKICLITPDPKAIASGTGIEACLFLTPPSSCSRQGIVNCLTDS